MILDPERALAGPDRLAWIEYRNYHRVAGHSERTIQNYGEAIAQLALHIAAGDLTTLTATRNAIGEYLLWCREAHSASTELNRYRSLRAYYNWLAAEDIIGKSPMARVPKPKAEQRVARVLTAEELSALLRVCQAGKGASAEARLLAARDRAVIAIWCEAGSPRLSEMSAMTTDDIDLDAGQVLVHGKGSKDRLVPLSPETVRDVVKYLRLRAASKQAAGSALWLGRRPGFGMRGLAEMLAERALQAKIGHVHPHELRHTAYDRFSDAGGQVDDAMRLFGWATLDMVLIYGKAAAAARSVRAGRAVALRAGL